MTGYKRKLCSNGCCFECDECNAKPGTPVLCADCLKRRYECYVKHNPIQPNDREAESEVTAAQALADLGREAWDSARGNRTTTYQPSGIDNLTFKPRLVFDVETAALPDAAQYLEPVEPPSNYRDPAVIARYKAEKQAEQLSRAALDPDLCRVVAIGAWDGQSVPWIETAGFRNATLDANVEGKMLAGFWSVVKGYHLVGYNCLAFDLPVLIRRSQYLGVPVPKLDLSKWRHEGITDLLQELSFNGVQKYRSLGWYCKRFGIDVPDLWAGADIANLVEKGEWNAVECHLAADLRKTAMLAGKLGLFAEVK